MSEMVQMALMRTETKQQIGNRARMRERYLKDNRLESFAEQEALELLLSYCTRQNDTNELASKMLSVFGSFANLLDSHPLDIVKRCQVSENVSVLVSMVPHLARLYNHSKWERRVRIASSYTAGKYLVELFGDRNTEAIYILCLDAQRRLINAALVNVGTVEEAPVYIRNIVETALLYQSVSVVLSHNHPGGSQSASGADIESTRQVIRAFELLDIAVLDHIIVSGANYYSFAENGGLLGLRY